MIIPIMPLAVVEDGARDESFGVVVNTRRFPERLDDVAAFFPNDVPKLDDIIYRPALAPHHRTDSGLGREQLPGKDIVQAHEHPGCGLQDALRERLPVLECFDTRRGASWASGAAQRVQRGSLL